jgi:eukaryotic-like serine/threonine-protein kinase
LGVQLAEALAHAHANGIFHRDLKPSNILMAPDGRPLLLDFNLSVDERRPNWRIGGTLPYMAPEELSALCESQPPSPRYDPRSDLFSLGVVLYELLTGALPFGTVAYDRPVEEIAAALRKRQAEGPRPVRERNSRVDRRLAGLIESCLAFEPKRRPKDADVLTAALRRELAISRCAVRWATAHRGLVLTTALIALLVVLGATAYLILRPPYSVRQFQQGLAYYEAGRDDLALQCLNASLSSEPGRSETLIARARVLQRRGNFQLAFADYDLANQMAPSPRIDACEGYCLSQLAQDQQAATYYRRALAAGYDSPAVLNNLGYGWLRLGRLDDAEACLRRAVQADETLQPAHHNLVVVHLQRAIAGKAIPSEAFVHARRALEIGPESGELYRNLAFFYALAIKQDAASAQAAISCVAKAVTHGIDPGTFKSDPAFSALDKDPGFQEALIVPGTFQEPVRAVRVIDPVGEFQ